MNEYSPGYHRALWFLVLNHKEKSICSQVVCALALKSEGCEGQESRSGALWDSLKSYSVCPQDVLGHGQTEHS